MSNKLTINANDEEIEIKTNRSDIAAALIRGIVGAGAFRWSNRCRNLVSNHPQPKNRSPYYLRQDSRGGSGNFNETRNYQSIKHGVKKRNENR